MEPPVFARFTMVAFIATHSLHSILAMHVHDELCIEPEDEANFFRFLSQSSIARQSTSPPLKHLTVFLNVEAMNGYHEDDLHNTQTKMSQSFKKPRALGIRTSSTREERRHLSKAGFLLRCRSCPTSGIVALCVTRYGIAVRPFIGRMVIYIEVGAGPKDRN